MTLHKGLVPIMFSSGGESCIAGCLWLTWRGQKCGWYPPFAGWRSSFSHWESALVNENYVAPYIAFSLFQENKWSNLQWTWSEWALHVTSGYPLSSPHIGGCKSCCVQSLVHAAPCIFRRSVWSAISRPLNVHN